MALPFLVVTAEAAFRSTDRRLEDAARTLGAGRWTVWRRIVLPSTWPSLAAGLVLCWARALGEFGATITFAGNFPGRTRTMPIAIYLAFESRPEEAIALSVVLVGVSSPSWSLCGTAGWAPSGERAQRVARGRAMHGRRVHLDVELDVASGQTVAVVGRNGRVRPPCCRCSPGSSFPTAVA